MDRRCTLAALVGLVAVTLTPAALAQDRAAAALTAGQMALNGYWGAWPPMRGGPGAGPPPGGGPPGGGRPGGRPPGGGPPPGAAGMMSGVAKLQPWARKIFDSYRAAEEAGAFVPSPNTMCYPWAIPGTGVPGGPAYGLQVLVEPRQVTFLYEMGRSMRIVRIDGQHPAKLEGGWMGDSVGYWEGDTLVVDTVGFNDRNILPMGAPMTAKMHIVQRLRVIDGKLEEQATFDDPGAFTGPFSTSSRYGRGQPFQEYICAENNHEGGVPTASGKPTPFNIPKK